MTRILTLLLIAALALVVSDHTLAQTDTTFTYQGELKQNGSSANGSFNLAFVLFDSEVGGSQVSSVLSLTGVPVVDGKFMVQLDWGAAVFDNTDRWLQVSVNGNALSPRNPITRAPYAIQTRGIFVNESGRVGIGTEEPEYNLHVVGAGGVQTPSIKGHSTNLQYGYGVEGVADGSLASAVIGNAKSPTGQSFGVYGTASSTTGIGVRGRVTANSGVNYGVNGRTQSTAGYDFYADGAGVDYGAESSRRWKFNVEPIDHPLQKIAELRGVYFDWDQEHGGKHDIGMIAEEVGKVLPEIVQYEENGVDAHGMDYSKMTPLLVEAVKALDERHQSKCAADARKYKKIEQENDSLRARIDSLERLVEQLAFTKREQPE